MYSISQNIRRLIVFIVFIISYSQSYSQDKIADSVNYWYFDFMEELQLNSNMFRECQCFTSDSNLTRNISDIKYCNIYLSQISLRTSPEVKVDTIRNKISFIERVSKCAFKKTDYSLRGEVNSYYLLLVNFNKVETDTLLVADPFSGNFTKIIYNYYFTGRYPHPEEIIPCDQ